MSNRAKTTNVDSPQTRRLIVGVFFSLGAMTAAGVGGIAMRYLERDQVLTVLGLLVGVSACAILYLLILIDRIPPEGEHHGNAAD